MEQWLQEQAKYNNKCYPQQLKAEPPQSPPAEKRIRLDQQLVQDWKSAAAAQSQSII